MTYSSKHGKNRKDINTNACSNVALYAFSKMSLYTACHLKFKIMCKTLRRAPGTEIAVNNATYYYPTVPQVQYIWTILLTHSLTSQSLSAFSHVTWWIASPSHSSHNLGDISGCVLPFNITAVLCWKFSMAVQWLGCSGCFLPKLLQLPFS